MLSGIKNWLLGREKESKSVAKSRLSFVLVQDRTGLSTDDLAGFKSEMVAVLQKYFVIDESGFDVSYKREKELTTLVINSPVIVRRQSAADHNVGARGKNMRVAQRKAEQAAGNN